MADILRLLRTSQSRQVLPVALAQLHFGEVIDRSRTRIGSALWRSIGLAFHLVALITTGSPAMVSAGIDDEFVLAVDRGEIEPQSPRRNASYPIAHALVGQVQIGDVANGSRVTNVIAPNSPGNDLPLVYVSTTTAYRDAPNIGEQRAECGRGNASACVKLADYDRLSKLCRIEFDYDACTAALRYQFAEQEVLTTARLAYVTFIADADVCEQRRLRDRCQKALAAPIAAHPRVAAKAAHVRRILADIELRRAQIPDVPSPPEEAQRLPEAAAAPASPGAATVLPTSQPSQAQQPIASRSANASSVERAKPSASDGPRAETSPRRKSMFTTAFFIMLGLGTALALTAALASHAGLIAPGLAYDNTGTPDAIALIKYGAISPVSVFKLVITLAVIGVAVTLIVMFTTLALILFGLAGIAAVFAYMRYQPAGK